MQMTDEEFGREKRYQAVMHFVRKMLSEGIITEEEYCQIDTNFQQKFRPIIGGLLSGRSLLYAQNRANMDVGKEAWSHEDS